MEAARTAALESVALESVVVEQPALESVVVEQPALESVVVEQPALESTSVGLKMSTESCDFWLGHFADEEAFYDFVGELPDQEDDDVPISRFIADQGQAWYDHDMMEVGFVSEASSVADLVRGASYSEQYAQALTDLAEKHGIERPNAFLFVTAGQVASPRSCRVEQASFVYVGCLTYAL